MRQINHQPAIRLAAGILALTTGLFAQTAILTGDAALQANSPQINFGALPQIELGPNSRGVVAYDLSQLPPNTTPAMLARTTLKVWVTKLGSGAASIYVAPSSTNWDEATVNWSNQPAPTAISPTTQRATRAASWVTFDVGAMLADALQTQKTAISFLLSSDGSVFLDSKESISTSHPAELQITLAGPQGLPGSPGPAGAMGPAGAKGATGDTGPAGRDGDRGLNGSIGLTGLTGLTGPAGPLGPIGPKGIAGLAGPMGPEGSPGPQGANGPQGPQGFQGVGIQGPQGVQGSSGAAVSLSTYQVLDHNVAVGSDSRRFLYCPSEYPVLVAGGCGFPFYINRLEAEPVVVYSGPDPDNPNRGWKCVAANSSAHTQVLRLYVNCAKP